jgi:hypothetical protein
MENVPVEISPKPIQPFLYETKKREWGMFEEHKIDVMMCQ